MSRPLGAFLFRNRGWIPAPAIVGALALCEPAGAHTALGLGLVPAALFVRLWAMLHIGPNARKKNVVVDKLIYTGPYELTRNPLYIANIAAYTGVGLATTGLVGATSALILACIYYSMIVRYEEVELNKRLGEVYRSYRNRVPRWMGESAPVHAAAPKGNMEDRLRNALRAERTTYALATAIILTIAIRSVTLG